MEFNEEIHDLIDRYLAKELTVKELTDFEKQLADSPALQKEVALVKSAQHLIFHKEAEAIKATMKDDFKRFKKTKTQLKVSLTLLGLLSAALLAWYLIEDTEAESNTNPPVLQHDKSKDSIQVKSLSSETAIEKNKEEKSLSIKTHQKKLAAPSLTYKADTSFKKVPSKETTATLSPPTLPPSDKETQLSKSTINAVQKHEKQVANPCYGITINATTVTRKTAFDDQTGEIRINMGSIKGGVSPYLFKLNNTEFGNGYAFSNLNKGDYVITIRDSKGCESTLPAVSVEKSLCLTNYNKTFYRESEQKWFIPHNKEYSENYRFSIYAPSGILLISKELDTFNDQFWDGVTEDGQAVDLGYYKFIIEYTHETCKGDITIFR